MLSSSSFFLSFKLHYFTFLFYVWYPATKLVSILCLYIHSKHHCYVCYCAVDTLLNQQLFCSMSSFSYFELAWRSRSLKYLNLVPAYFWPLTHMQLKSHSINALFGLSSFVFLSDLCTFCLSYLDIIAYTISYYLFITGQSLKWNEIQLHFFSN